MPYSKRWICLSAVAALGGLLLGGCAASAKRGPAAVAATAPPVPTTQAASAAQSAATAQVIAAEDGFAKSMADRNFKAFVAFLSPEAVFFTGNRVEHGPAEVAEEWEPYFRGAAPFAWRPDHVEVLPSGTLALSTGPILQEGRMVGRFNSVWRLEGPNTWRIVFDKGEAVCASGR